MENQVKISWKERTSTKKGTKYDFIEYIYTDEEGTQIVLTTDFEMNDIKRYVLKQLGIKKETE